MRSVFFIILLFCCIVTCSDNPVTGVTDSRNYVRGKVITENLEAVANAKVYLVKPNIGKSGAEYRTIDSTQTDTSGVWEFQQENGSYLVVSLGNTTLGQSIKKVTITEDETKKNIIVHTKSSKTLFGHVFLGNRGATETIEVSIMGTDITTKANSDGSYALANVPTGDCDILYSSSSTYYLSSVRTNSGESLITLKDIVLPENGNSSIESEYEGAKIVQPIEYDSNEIPTYYEGVNFHGVEYVMYNETGETVVDASGEKLIPLTSFEQIGAEMSIHKVWSESDLNAFYYTYIMGTDSSNQEAWSYEPGVSGLCRYTEFIYGDSTTTTLGTIAMFFDFVDWQVTPHNVNLSGAKSINFYMKGNGNIKVMLQDSLTGARSGAVFSQFEKQIELQDDWTFYEIPIDSFTCSEYIDTVALDLHREGSLKKVEYLQFLTIADPGDTVQFWLDEVSITGVSLEDISRSKK